MTGASTIPTIRAPKKSLHKLAHAALNLKRYDMENQHRLITGYRELNETEIALMNRIKALSTEISILIRHVEAHLHLQRQAANATPMTIKDPGHGANPAEQHRLGAAEPERWLAMGRTDLQTGLMKLTRAVAQPGFF